MDEEKKEGALGKNGHKVALGGRLLAALSILFLVPVIRRIREQRLQKQQKRRLHFPSFGH